MIFCEAVAIYGVIISIILHTKIEKPDPLSDANPTALQVTQQWAGYSIFWAGICCGIGNLACGCTAALHHRPMP